MNQRKAVQVRMRPRLHQSAKRAAAQENRSFSNWLEQVIQQALDQKNRETANG